MNKQYNIIEYTQKREKQIRANYDTEHANARKLPICFSQSAGNELIDTEFTAQELLTLDKTIRDTLGAEYDVVHIDYGDLGDSGNGKSYVCYGIIHKDLFKRSKSKWDKTLKSFTLKNATPSIIHSNTNGYYSTSGFTWLTFQKDSNPHIILYRSDDVETFGHKPKHKKHWGKMGHIYMISDVLFDKYLESVKNGIEKVKQMFDKFK